MNILEPLENTREYPGPEFKTENSNSPSPNEEEHCDQKLKRFY